MFRIHFLNVGQGDCTIIEHPSGRTTMIDINNGDDYDSESKNELVESYSYNGTLNSIRSLIGDNTFLKRSGYNVELTNPITYYKDKIGNSVFRYIQTHPDVDHMRGLIDIPNNNINITNYWDTDNNKVITDFKDYVDKQNWQQYCRIKSGNLYKRLIYHQGDKNKYYNQDDLNGLGDGIYILAPTIHMTNLANEKDKPNLHSYVLWVKCYQRIIVLGGDAENENWEEIFNKYGKNLKCDILKASHHGRDSGYHQASVAAMRPEYTVVSVGSKPKTDASNKYRQYSDNVLSTRYCGNIIFEIYGDGSIICETQYD